MSDKDTIIALQRNLADAEVARRKAEERIDCYGLGDEACGSCLKCLKERWESELHRRVVAQQRAEKAEAERDSIYATLSAAGISHGGTVEGLRQGLEVVARVKAERDELKASLLRLRSEFADLAQSHDKMEAERDAAVKSLADHGDALDRVTRERDEARALYRETEEKYAREVSAHDKTAQERDEALVNWKTTEAMRQDTAMRLEECARQHAEARAERARLQDLHTRCAAFDDQPGPSCVRLAAEVARLREALELAERKLSGDDDLDRSTVVDEARAALAGTSDEWLRALVTRAVRAGDENMGGTHRSRPISEVVEEVLNGKA